MPIVDADLDEVLTTTAGSQGSSEAQGDPNASLGKYFSTTEVSGTPLHNLFDVISAAENDALDVEYRAIGLINNHLTLTLQSSKVWISTQPASGAQWAIGLDPVGVVDKDTVAVQGATIASESAAPAGVSFSAPLSFAAGLSIGNVGPEQGIMLWIRRTAADGAAIAANAAFLSWQGDTAA